MAGSRWSVDEVMAVAPDSSSQVAGRRLARPGPWSQLGAVDGLVWGECQGSGRTPYRVSVDTAARRYQCSCPSRKFPCKHAVGLLFLWTAGAITETGEIAEHAAAFAAGGRSPAPGGSTGDAEGGDGAERGRTPDPKAAADRAAARDRRVTDGLAELDRWLADQVAAGLARVPADPWAWAEPTAARMVDAQAPGVAARLRALPALVAEGGDWPARLLEELALLHLLAEGWSRRSDLPGDLVATLREHIGFTVPRADVVGGPAVTDRWIVVGLRDLESDTVSTRRVWLYGSRTDRWAQVLFFAAGGAALDSGLVPGTAVEADLHFYPGRAGLRAAVGDVHADAVPVTDWSPPVAGIADTAARWAAALAADPWQRQIPVVLRGRVEPGEHGWSLVDPADRGVTVRGDELDRWRLYAQTAGTVAEVAGEWSPAGFHPSSLIRSGSVVTLAAAW